MPRYPGNQLSDENMVRHAGLYGPQAEVVVAARRAWNDPACLDRLLVLGRALEAWAGHFKTPAVVALAAASVTRDSLQRLPQSLMLVWRKSLGLHVPPSPFHPLLEWQVDVDDRRAGQHTAPEPVWIEYRWFGLLPATTGLFDSLFVGHKPLPFWAAPTMRLRSNN